MKALITERNLPSGHDLFAAMRALYFEVRETEAAANEAECEHAADDLWRSFDRQVDELLELLWALEVGGHLAAISNRFAVQEGKA
ncbi:MAG: hypothetical protein K0B16_14850 [Burkholderiaceae bacterium]|nr:hypothetical protein [Burkholderiaceae bacterium]